MQKVLRHFALMALVVGALGANGPCEQSEGALLYLTNEDGKEVHWLELRYQGNVGVYRPDFALGHATCVRGVFPDASTLWACNAEGCTQAQTPQSDGVTASNCARYVTAEFQPK